MSAISRKLRSVEGGRVMFWCPGCDGAHRVGVGQGPGPRWGYNGNADAPTFTPSVLFTYNGPDAGIDGTPTAVCHFFVTNGRIQFLNDCTHTLAGQTVDLPDFDED